MESLKTLMDEILETKADMAIEPNDADPRVRSGIEARVRNATAKLPGLETKYRDAVKNHVVLIGVVGPAAEEFANIAKYAFKTATADYNTLNHRLQRNFAARSARMDFNNQESYMLLDELAKLKHEFGIYTLPNPSFNIGNVNIFGEHTHKVIDQVLRHNYGNQLHTLALMNDIAKIALASHFAGKLLPVIVYSSEVTAENMTLDEAILPKLHNIFTVGEVVTDETVKSVLDKVKQSLNVKPSTAEAAPLAPELAPQAALIADAILTPTIGDAPIEVAVNSPEVKKSPAKAAKK